MRATIAALVLIVSGPFMTTPAAADYCALHGWRQVGEWPNYYSQRYCRRWARTRAERVYSYENRREWEELGPRQHCLFEFPAIRATGDDKLEEERAQVSAQDRWSIEVETLRGTRFSDIRNAIGMTSACVRKVPTSATEKGQAILGLRHFVCSIEAVPCAAPKLLQDDDTRAKRPSEKRAEESEGRKADPRDGFYEEPAQPKKRYWRWRRPAP